MGLTRQSLANQGHARRLTRWSPNWGRHDWQVVPVTRTKPTHKETVIAHRIKLSSDSLNLRVDVDDNGRIAIATIAGGGTSLRAGHHVPVLELQSVEAPHPTPVMRLAGSTGAARLRYREHQTGVDSETHWLAVTAEDVDRVRARWLLRTGAGSAALTSTVEVSNIAGRAVPRPSAVVVAPRYQGSVRSSGRA
jgi:hypothetical protein